MRHGDVAVEVLRGREGPLVDVHPGAEEEPAEAADGGQREAVRLAPVQHARASSAPPTPTAPQPAICQTVHGPWERKMFDTIAVTAPTAKPGIAPSA